MKIQETIITLERGLTMEAMVNLSDADLDRFERSCYHWQQAAFREQCRRDGVRADREDLIITTGAGKTFSGVRFEEQGHVI